MKLFSYEINRHGITRIKERFKGTVDVAGVTTRKKRFSIGEHSWSSRCKKFENMYQQYPMLKQGILTLAGIVMSEGAHTSPATNKQDETYNLAEEAKWRVDNSLHKRHNINSLLYQTVNIMCKFGSCFWEKTETPEFSYRIIPNQESIEPASYDDTGEITEWRQVIMGTTYATWNSQEIVHFAWNVCSNSWPYGTPLLIGLDVETEALLGLEESAKDFMEKEAWPYEILSLGDSQNQITTNDYNTAKIAWKNRQPGQGITSRNIPINLLKGGTGDTPLRELSDLMELLKDNVQDGLMVPAISKLYNSTEASAKVMTQHVMTVLGQPIQWLLKERYEEDILKPFMEASGFSVKACPELIFESPNVHKKEDGEFWVSLVSTQIATPQQAADALGIEYDEEYFTKKEEQMLQQQQANNEQKPQGDDSEGKPQQNGVTYEVRIKPDKRDLRS